MGQYEINVALSTRLEAMGLPTAYENKPFDPVPGQLYVAETFIPAPTQGVGVAAGSADQYTGVYQVTVLAPRDKGKKLAHQTADAVVAQFKRNTEMVYGGVLVRVEISYAEESMTQGDRFVIPVSIFYVAFF